jgi:hypothetical protein
MKTLACREAGFEEIFQKGGEHATKDHGMKAEDITPEFKEKLRGLIRTAG